MRCQMVFCVVIGLLLTFNINFQDAVIFKFTNIVCESYNQSWVVFRYCRLKAVGRDRVHLNVNATILYPAYNITNHGKIFKRASGYKPWILDTTVDACRFVRKNYDPFAKIVFSLFKNFSNINHTCPFVGHQILKDFYLKPELLILPFPTGDYMLSMRWYFGKRLQFDTNVSFVFVEDLIKS